jgi:osmotically-inducible protein OsmY
MTDKMLRDAVLRELDWEPRVNAAHIGVSASNGAITLSGEVPTFTARNQAVKAAERVYGVRAVADELTIELSGPHRRNDSEIAEAVSRSLRWSNEVPGNVDAEIRNGFVTLTGQVEWQFQRVAAMRAVRDLHGVTGVANEVAVVNPHPRPADVEQRIRQAFERHARLDARQVDVSIAEGTAHLHGHVHSIFEKHVAEQAAAGAPGVSRVDDRVVVVP